ncbi:transposase [Gemmata obscuriglobus]
MCELPRKMAAVLSITLLYLPGYSPNLNLIERLWRFLKRKSVYGKYYPNFATFRAAIKDTLSELNTTHAEPLAALMALQFQEFEDVSLLTE